MKNIQNKALAMTVLNIRGASYTGDHEGVFAMDEKHADQMLATPGWSGSKRGPEAEPKSEAFDPAATLRTGDSMRAELASAQTRLIEANAQLGVAQQRIATTEAQRADLADALQRAHTEIAELKAAAIAPSATPERPAVTPAAPGAPAPSATPEQPAAETQGTGPDLEELDKAGLLDAAERWNAKLTSAQKRMSAENLRPILDKAIYGGGE